MHPGIAAGIVMEARGDGQDSRTRYATGAVAVAHHIVQQQVRRHPPPLGDLFQRQQEASKAQIALSVLLELGKHHVHVHVAEALVEELEVLAELQEASAVHPQLGAEDVLLEDGLQLALVEVVSDFLLLQAKWI